MRWYFEHSTLSLESIPKGQAFTLVSTAHAVPYLRVSSTISRLEGYVNLETGELYDLNVLYESPKKTEVFPLDASIVLEKKGE